METDHPTGGTKPAGQGAAMRPLHTPPPRPARIHHMAPAGKGTLPDIAPDASKLRITVKYARSLPDEGGTKRDAIIAAAGTSRFVCYLCRSPKNGLQLDFSAPLSLVAWSMRDIRAAVFAALHRDLPDLMAPRGPTTGGMGS
jgi:hypothetical protein